MIELIYIYTFIIISYVLSSHIVRLKSNKKIFYLNHGIAKEIVDIKTLNYLGYDLIDIDIVEDNYLYDYTIDDKVVMSSTESSADLLLIQINKILLLQSNIFHNLFIYSYNYINPSIIKYHNRLIICTALYQPNTPFNRGDGYLKFGWFDDPLGIYSSDPYLSLTNQLTELNVKLYGEDPRMILLSNGSIMILFTGVPMFNHKHSRIGSAILSIDTKLNKLIITSINQNIYPSHEHWKSQKNWIPFSYRNEILAIQYLNPLLVVNITSGTNATKVTKLSSDNQSVSWPYGEIRGGTNALFIGDQYLGFFHSRIQLPNRSEFTYFMGAYTFTRHRPFQITSISKLPIVDLRLYTSEIHDHANDYIVFPTSCYWDIDLIVVTGGYQDNGLFMASFQLASILSTLRDID